VCRQPALLFSRMTGRLARRLNLPLHRRHDKIHKLQRWLDIIAFRGGRRLPSSWNSMAA
jgi:hypothetical protein